MVVRVSVDTVAAMDRPTLDRFTRDIWRRSDHRDAADGAALGNGKAECPTFSTASRFRVQYFHSPPFAAPLGRWNPYSRILLYSVLEDMPSMVAARP